MMRGAAPEFSAWPTTNVVTEQSRSENHIGNGHRSIHREWPFSFLDYSDYHWMEGPILGGQLS